MNDFYVLLSISCFSGKVEGEAEGDVKLLRGSSALRLKIPLGNDSDPTENQKEKSPVKDVTDKIFASSKSILGKVLSPTKEKKDKVMSSTLMSNS